MRSEGHDVRLLDLQANPSPNRLADEIASFEPEIVGIASTSPSHKAALDTAATVKELRPSTILLNGGVPETYCSEPTLLHNAQIDYSMHGEVDEAILQFVDRVGTPALLETPSLTFRRESQIHKNPAIQRKIALDDLPYPARELLEPSTYYDFKIFAGRRTTQVQTMRGCPFQCSFCNQRNRRPNVRSISSVLDELRFLRESGYQAVFFDDATFTVLRERTRELCDSIVEADLGLQFACQTRAELVDVATINSMAAAGFVYISFGLETTDTSALQILNKTPSATNHTAGAETAVKLCLDAGMKQTTRLNAHSTTQHN